MKSPANSRRILFRLFLITLTTILVFLQTSLVQGSEKKSLKAIGEQLKKASEITEFYKSGWVLSKKENKELESVLAENQTSLSALLADFDSSANFYRGEIEDEKTLNSLIAYLQLSILKDRQLTQNKKWNELEKNFQSWFQFTADFPYEEASLVGLRTTAVIRSLLLDEIENIQNKFPVEVAKKDVFQNIFSSMRSPWPIDRVVITESKKSLSGTRMRIAEILAKALQSNPYQTSEAALKKIKGGGAKELQFLNEIWRDKDIDLMKTEVNRIGHMRLKIATGRFEVKSGKKPTSAEELVSSGFLKQIPLDYKTGKAMDLER